MKWDSIVSTWDDQFTPWDATSDFVATKTICADVEVSQLEAAISLSTVCALATVSAVAASLSLSCLHSAIEVSRVDADVEVY